MAALGHRRLSIIDVGESGHQPMCSHDGRFTIVFNGEIYNYLELRRRLEGLGAEFRTSSDTEVILEAWRAWGSDALAQFRGMFAFALHDAKSASVVFARDPFGKKPLFLARGTTNGRPMLVFGSEIPALLEHPAIEAELNEPMVRQYLMWRYAPGPETFFRNITKLPPGCSLRVTARGEELQRYFTPPEQDSYVLVPEEEAVEQFVALFDESVSLRLRADVPVGAFLSSGLDSSSIAATVTGLGVTDLRTFSIGFRGDPASELPAAEATAEAIGSIHTSLELDIPTLKAQVPMLTRHLAAPLADVASLPVYLISREAKRSVKVILSGEGADEMFGGYPKHRVEARVGGLSPGTIERLGKSMGMVSRVSPDRLRRLRISSRALEQGEFGDRMVAWFGALTPGEVDAVWIGDRGDLQVDALPFSAPQDASGLRRVLHFDQTSWLPDNLLERLDIMTMAASLEGRAPFMDVELARFAASLPDAWRIKGKATKRIIREGLADRLPPAVLSRPKNGFRLPVADWFRTDLEEPFQELLLGGDSRTKQLIDPEFLAGLAAEHSSRRVNHDKTLWALYALEIFLREFF